MVRGAVGFRVGYGSVRGRFTFLRRDARRRATGYGTHRPARGRSAGAARGRVTVARFHRSRTDARGRAARPRCSPVAFRRRPRRPRACGAGAPAAARARAGTGYRTRRARARAVVGPNIACDEYRLTPISACDEYRHVTNLRISADTTPRRRAGPRRVAGSVWMRAQSVAALYVLNRAERRAGGFDLFSN